MLGNAALDHALLVFGECAFPPVSLMASTRACGPRYLRGFVFHHPPQLLTNSRDRWNSMAARPPPMAGPEGGAPFRPLLRKKGAMTGLQTTSAEQSFRHLMTKGEALHPERFGGGFCCAGRTIPRSNGSSLVCMASLGKLQVYIHVHLPPAARNASCGTIFVH